MIVFDSVVFALILARAISSCKRLILSRHILLHANICPFLCNSETTFPISLIFGPDTGRLYLLFGHAWCAGSYLYSVYTPFWMTETFFCRFTALSVSNLVILVTVPTSSTLATILTPVLRASFSILGSRIILNLKETQAAEAALNRGLDIKLDALRTGSSQTTSV